jgi:hypothetical protein
MTTPYTNYYPPGVQEALYQQQQQLPYRGYPIQGGYTQVINPHENTSIDLNQVVYNQPNLVEYSEPITNSRIVTSTARKNTFKPGDYHPVHGKTAHIQKLHDLMDQLNELHAKISDLQSEAHETGASFLTQAIRKEINDSISQLGRV